MYTLCVFHPTAPGNEVTSARLLTQDVKNKGVRAFLRGKILVINPNYLKLFDFIGSAVTRRPWWKQRDRYNRPMKTSLFLILVLGFCGPAFAENVFDGTFDVPQVSSALCNNLLDQQVYTVRHYLIGNPQTTSVLNFQLKSTDPTAQSFLQNITLTGLYGYNDDFNDDRTFDRDGKEYHVIGQGMVDSQLLVVDVTVELHNPGDATIICTATAEFSAFH